jgi:hypothetical protein
MVLAMVKGPFHLSMVFTMVKMVVFFFQKASLALKSLMVTLSGLNPLYGHGHGNFSWLCSMVLVMANSHCCVIYSGIQYGTSNFDGFFYLASSVSMVFLVVLKIRLSSKSISIFGGFSLII